MQIGDIINTECGRLGYLYMAGRYRPLNYEVGGPPIRYKSRTGKTLPRIRDGLEPAVEFLRACFVEALENRGEGVYDVSRFAFLEERAGFYMPSIHFGPCHARMNSPEKGIVALLTSPDVKVWSTWNRGNGSRDCYGSDEFERDKIEAESRRYWSWLLNDSPWAHVFVEKYDPDLAGAVGVRMDVHAPGNLVCQALTATRVPHEYPNRVRFWSRMTARGADPVAALVLSEFTQPRLTPDVMLKYRGEGGNIHDMFSERLPLDVVTRIKNLSMVTTTKPLVDKCAFGGVHALWGGAERVIGPRVKEVLQEEGERPPQYEWRWRSLQMEKVEQVPGMVAYDKGIEKMLPLAQQLTEMKVC